jgi:hypothetical protein
MENDSDGPHQRPQNCAIGPDTKCQSEGGNDGKHRRAGEPPENGPESHCYILTPCEEERTRQVIQRCCRLPRARQSYTSVFAALCGAGPA